MPQYIENPSLMGARMADQMSQQRMNLVGQAISQASDALNKQAAADAQAQMDILQQLSLLKAGYNPRSGRYEGDQARTAAVGFGDPVMQVIALRNAARGGYDPTKLPTDPMYRIGPRMTPVAQAPIVGEFGMFPAMGIGQELMRGRERATPYQQSRLMREGIISEPLSPFQQLIRGLGIK